MELKNIIAKNITELRKKHKLTQAEFAERLNYTDKAISKWERGESIPSIEILKQISDMFGVTVDYLLHDLPIDQKSEYILPRENTSNKITITLLVVTMIWLIATVIYVYTRINLSVNHWTIFLWAVPESCLILLMFNSRWGRRVYTFYILTTLTWSSLTCFYIQFLRYQIWLIFIVGIPIQIAIILWANFKPSKAKQERREQYYK
ncbi:MAG: helix-turn-helix transcriptional regulator [Clostridia bacterium]|nr:helix-turn-helix transcriptional regulator [Clostridia bacterium]